MSLYELDLFQHRWKRYLMEHPKLAECRSEPRDLLLGFAAAISSSKTNRINSTYIGQTMLALLEVAAARGISVIEATLDQFEAIQKLHGKWDEE